MKTNKSLYLFLILSMAVITLPAWLSGCTAGNGEATDTPVQEQIAKDIPNAEAYTLIQANKGNENFVIIDVRTREEYADGHIENAINIDYNSDSFRDNIDNLDRNKTYLIYCRSGRRSAGALDVMAELGFKEVYNMAGGILEWQEAGQPLVK